MRNLTQVTCITYTSLLLALFAGSACGPMPADSIAAPRGDAVLLNSDRIRKRFGSYGVEILYQDEKLRLTSLYSTSGGLKTGRTIAVVEFSLPVSAAIAAVHRDILGGASIGERFRDAGWTVVKRGAIVGTLSIEACHRPVVEIMGLDDPVDLAFHQYQLRVARDATEYAYARITEIHHPDYLDTPALTAIHAPVTRSHAPLEKRIGLDLSKLLGACESPTGRASTVAENFHASLPREKSCRTHTGLASSCDSPASADASEHPAAPGAL